MSRFFARYWNPRNQTLFFKIGAVVAAAGISMDYIIGPDSFFQKQTSTIATWRNPCCNETNIEEAAGYPLLPLKMSADGLYPVLSQE